MPDLSAQFVKQTKFGEPDGNCLEACFATLTGIPLDDIPHFLQATWFFRYRMWLRKRGWHIEHFAAPTPLPGVAIAGGFSERGIRHSCIYLDGELFHDPHPSNAGLVSVEDYILVWPTFETAARLRNGVAE